MAGVSGMEPKLRGLPPGRAGRMWLTRRLGLAERGAELLERKLQILRSEEQAYTLLQEQTQAEWDAAMGQLDLWTLRATLAGGQRGLLMAIGPPATAEIAWRLTMGVRYPSRAECRTPARPISAPPPDSTALLHATEAARRAVQAGVDHAVAVAALSAVQTEIGATSRQLRAVRERWLPRLASARAALTTTLDDQEHDEGTRLRWAADPTRGRMTRQ